MPFLQNIEALKRSNQDLDREVEMEDLEARGVSEAFKNQLSSAYMGNGPSTTGIHKSGGIFRRFGSYSGAAAMEPSQSHLIERKGIQAKRESLPHNMNFKDRQAIQKALH